MITFAFTYQIVTPESAENGDFDDHGFVVDGHEFSLNNEKIADDILNENPDDYHTQWKLGTLEEVIRIARNYGISEPSDSTIQCGTWFYSVDPDINYRTGEDTTYSFHVDGVTRSTLRRIHRLLTA